MSGSCMREEISTMVSVRCVFLCCQPWIFKDIASSRTRAGLPTNKLSNRVLILERCSNSIAKIDETKSADHSAGESAVNQCFQQFMSGYEAVLDPHCGPWQQKQDHAHFDEE